MNAIQKMETWADRHHPLWLDFGRIALGIFLFIKGLIFIGDSDRLMSMMSANMGMANLGMAHYVAFAHLIGGMFVAFGLYTRVAILVQIPILIGAVLLVNLPDNFYSMGYNLEFFVSLAVLILLFVYLFYGSGRLSLDEYKKTHPMA